MRARQLRHNGVRMSVEDWAEELDMTYSGLWRRLRAGWPVRDALTLPKWQGQSLEKRKSKVPKKCWCPFCGEASDTMDFCDARCMVEYWRDCRREMPHEVTR